jgi:hypothetical protein
LTKLAFIVEGRSEQKIVQKICPDSKALLLDCNGSHVKTSAIAKKIGTLYRIMNNRYFPIIVVFDREKRDASCEEIIEQLEQDLEKLDLDKNQFRIGVADRKLESWMLYGIDRDGNINTACTTSKNSEFEGTTASGEIRIRLKKNDLKYHKTTLGVEIFASLEANKLRLLSPSFNSFAEKIEPHCKWINKD